MLLKCPCQQCGVNLEFDSEQGNEFVDCPSCARPTRLLLPSKPKPAPPALTKTDRIATRIFWVVLGLLVLGILAVLFYQHQLGEFVANTLGLAGGAAMGILALVLMIIGFVLAVFWIIFPWMVYVLLKKIEANTRPKQ